MSEKRPIAGNATVRFNRDARPDGVTGESFAWAVPTTLPSDVYTLEIVDSAEVPNYSVQFQVTANAGGSQPETPPVSPPLSTTSSTSPTSTTSTTSVPFPTSSSLQTGGGGNGGDGSGSLTTSALVSALLSADWLSSPASRTSSIAEAKRPAGRGTATLRSWQSLGTAATGRVVWQGDGRDGHADQPGHDVHFLLLLCCGLSSDLVDPLRISPDTTLPALEAVDRADERGPHDGNHLEWLDMSGEGHCVMQESYASGDEMIKLVRAG